MINFLLMLVAYGLFLPLTIVNLLVVMWRHLYRRQWSKSLKNLNSYFLETAVDIDRFGNRNFRALFNLTLRKQEGYPFGDERETISSVMGKNKRAGTLTFTGRCLAGLLDLIDKNHCLKSIKELDVEQCR